MPHYYPHTEKQISEMLKTLNKTTIDELFTALPPEVLCKTDLKLPLGKSEVEVTNAITRLSMNNTLFKESYLGGGAYHHYIPTIVQHLLSRSEFYTGYTPYQPELSQGTLQSIFEFQSLICELTAMDVSNASVYDGSSAAIEAISMAVQIIGKRKVGISLGLSPEVMAVVNTYCNSVGIEIEEVPLCNYQSNLTQIKEKAFAWSAFLFQTPNFYGELENGKDLVSLLHSQGSLAIVSVYPISLGILSSPGEYDADIVIGEGQCLGNPLNFGGPYLGFMATKQQYLRKLPGRIVGQTTDEQGNIGFVLTLQAREQHIRREKALSNICTNEALNALAACIYLSTLGRQGIVEVANQCIQKAHYLANKLSSIPNYKILNTYFFNEFLLQTPMPASELQSKLHTYGIQSGLPLSSYNDASPYLSLWAVTELHSKEQLDKLCSILEEC